MPITVEKDLKQTNKGTYISILLKPRVKSQKTSRGPGCQGHSKSKGKFLERDADSAFMRVVMLKGPITKNKNKSKNKKTRIER